MVNVITPQNVEVEYDLAGSASRIMALVLDQIIIVFSFLILGFLMAAVFPEQWLGYIFFFTLLPIYLFYSPFFEMVNFGQTPGKKMIGIKVVRIDGQEVGWMQSLSRWIFRILDIFVTAGGLALLLINSNERKQRLGDVMGGAMVIREYKAVNVSLDRLIHLKTTEDYKVHYPLVTRLREEDVVLIKSVLDRNDRYGNEAHRKAVRELAKKLVDILGVEPQEKRNEDFLKKMVNDYVVLTR
ncbi:MAG: RDD family protein [Bacteroidota bacterium]|nr:RDD family protein [Bacteroidota bacterium]MDX5449264.1 RDD family protein [Bacteroidota bacterium]MDX5506486.1 RDD family protein [Bacteroidota bacterium]